MLFLALMSMAPLTSQSINQSARVTIVCSFVKTLLSARGVMDASSDLTTFRAPKEQPIFKFKFHATLPAHE